MCAANFRQLRCTRPGPLWARSVSLGEEIAAAYPAGESNGAVRSAGVFLGVMRRPMHEIKTDLRPSVLP